MRGAAPHVLVVDDDDDVREVLAMALEEEGFSVTTAANGLEALTAIGALPRPAVIVLDLLMPVLSGWETIEALRLDGRLAELPVIICSSAPQEAPAGFPVIPKPVVLDRLVAAIEGATR